LDVILQLIDDSWSTWESMGQAVLRLTEPQPQDAELDERPPPLYKQETLRVFVTAALPLLRQSSSLWSMDRLRQLLSILKGIMTHPPGDDIRPDIDNLTPLQSAIFDVFALLDLSLDGSAAVFLEDLSSLITLAYASSHDGDLVAALDETGKKPVARRLTYIAVSKRAMELAVEIFLAHQSEEKLYASATVEHVIKAYSLPVSQTFGLDHQRGTDAAQPSPSNPIDQAQVRLPSVVQVWRRTTALEDGQSPLPSRPPRS
jgi:hypothetical protein